MTRTLPIIGIITACICVLGLITLAAVEFVRDYHRCVDNGGHFERRNCHEVHGEYCSTTDWGNGVETTSCYPTTTTECDRVCIGANAEAR